MISNQETLNLSPFMAIYDIVVPKDNMLRQINELVDFSFILEELKTKYCLDNGRNAIPPIRMFKYFLDMAPEDDVIDPSSLTKFRRLRLKDVGLLDMLIGKTVEIALEKKLIKSNTIIVDATHTKARYNQKSPIEFLQEKSKNVRKAIYKIDESMKDKLPEKITSNEVDDELGYCKKVIEVIENEPQIVEVPAVKERLNTLKEVVEDTQYHLQYSVDTEARIGHKTADSSFFGYKTHIAMSDERIITAATVTTGEKSDGHYLQELIEKSKATGMEIDTVIGDTAYSGKDNLVYTNQEQIQLIAKLNPILTKGGHVKEFDFNKDAGMFVCPAGHMATRKARTGKKGQKKNQSMTFYFDIEKCKTCPLREGCYKEGAKSKTYSVTIKSTEHKEQAAFQETEQFKELARKRYKIEAKNSELKNPHGYETAQSAGLFGMGIQAATTIFAVNLKRIIKLVNEKE